MAVYYRFKSEKDFDSIPIHGQFISLGKLKDEIFESKRYGRGSDFDFMISNAETNEEYVEESALIPKHTSVLIRRIPRRTGKAIVCVPDKPKVAMDSKVEDIPPPNSTITEEPERDDFGDDLCTISRIGSACSSDPVQDVGTLDRDGEEMRIKALVETSALEWQNQQQDGCSFQRGFGKGVGGRMMAGRGLGRGGLPHKTPPEGYVCHRCNVPGHFIQHCPTNGDPDYDIKRARPPTGIPKSMLMVTPDGSYSLPSGDVAVLKPNGALFEREMEGLPSTYSVSNIPPELHCPMCKDVMKDAMLTSKCCFSSFCDKCIRGYIISKAKCICGATNILADDLIPNKTLRATITCFLESLTTSSGNTRNSVHFHDVGSACHVQQSVLSSTLTAASKDEHRQSTGSCSPDLKEGKGVTEVEEDIVAVHTLEKNDFRNVDPSEAKPLSINAKEPISQKNIKILEGVQEESHGCGAQGGKKKKKRTRPPSSGADMQWGCAGMPLAPPAYNTYMTGCAMPWGTDEYMGQFMSYMGYTPGPFDASSWGMLPQDPFGTQAYIFPAPRRDLSGLGIRDNINQSAPVVSKEGFRAKKYDPSREHESMQFNEREHHRYTEMDRKLSSSSADISLMKLKNKPMSATATAEASGRRDGVTHELSSPAQDPAHSSLSRRTGRGDGAGSRNRRTPERRSGMIRAPEDEHRPTSNTHHSSRDDSGSSSMGERKRSVDCDRDLSEEEEEEYHCHFKRRRPSWPARREAWGWESEQHESRRERDCGRHPLKRR